jgi:hypothetical protein
MCVTDCSYTVQEAVRTVVAEPPISAVWDGPSVWIKPPLVVVGEVGDDVHAGRGDAALVVQRLFGQDTQDDVVLVGVDDPPPSVRWVRLPWRSNCSTTVAELLGPFWAVEISGRVVVRWLMTLVPLYQE